jgi:hypothetical protein
VPRAGFVLHCARLVAGLARPLLPPGAAFRVEPRIRPRRSLHSRLPPRTSSPQAGLPAEHDDSITARNRMLLPRN